jgi:Ni/Co efflux regulator RcnB
MRLHAIILAAGLLLGAPAATLAEPPAWAPAHGWRAKAERQAPPLYAGQRRFGDNPAWRDAGRRARQERRDERRAQRRGERLPPPRYLGPPQAAPPRAAQGYRRGRILPPQARGQMVSDYGRYRLRRPPPGYAYYRVGGTVFLANQRTGLIFETVPLGPAPRRR